MIERLAIWYLSRRGRVVLPFPFIGIVFGCCTAQKTSDDGGYVDYHVSMPKIGQRIVLNHSVVNDIVPSLGRLTGEGIARCPHCGTDYTPGYWAGSGRAGNGSDM